MLFLRDTVLLSLRFKKMTKSILPEEVNDMLSDLEKDNGFWSRTSAELNTMADKIDQHQDLTPNKM